MNTAGPDLILDAALREVPLETIAKNTTAGAGYVSNSTYRDNSVRPTRCRRFSESVYTGRSSNSSSTMSAAAVPMPVGSPLLVPPTKPGPTVSAPETVASKGATTFTLLPTLPSEIRILIWEATLESRLIEIRYDDNMPTGFFAATTNPMALELCRDSREAVLHLYPLRFGSIFHPPMIRFNLALDILYMDERFQWQIPHLFSTFGKLEIEGLQTLAVHADLLSQHGYEDEPFHRGMERAVQSLKGLKEMLVVHDVECMANEDVGCVEEHPMYLYKELPEIFKNTPRLSIADLPDSEDSDIRKIRKWKIPSVRPVYGWRRCPGGIPGYRSEDSEDEERDMWEDYDDDDGMIDIGDIGPLGHMGISFAHIHHGLGGWSDDDDDDEGEENDEDDEGEEDDGT